MNDKQAKEIVAQLRAFGADHGYDVRFLNREAERLIAEVLGGGPGVLAPMPVTLAEEFVRQDENRRLQRMLGGGN